MSASAAVASFPGAPKGYTKLMNAVIRAKLKPGPKTLYMALASYAWGGDVVTVSQARLAADCDVTERSVRRWTRHLEQAGWIRTYETQGLVNRYELMVPHHPGQVVKEVRPEPRIEKPANPGQNGEPGNNPYNEIPNETRPQGMNPGDDIWQQAQLQLAAELTKANYQMWVAGLSVVERTPQTLILQAPSIYVLDWVQTRLAGTIEKAVITAAGRRLRVEYRS